MRYALVATASYILLVDLVDRIVSLIEGHRTEYFGISWFADDRNLVLSHSGLDNETLVDMATYAQSEVGWISAGALESSRFLSQPHQILCLADGRVACTNTGRNAVTIIDLHKPGLFQEARISPSRWDRLALDDFPGDHLNSVFARHDHLYVVAHRFNKGSQLAVFSLPDLRLIEVKSWGRVSGLHNIFVTDDGRKIACHSAGSSLIDLTDNRILWESGTASYTRGLAVTSDHILIGNSAESGRGLRRHSMSGLSILDRRTWQASDYLALGPYGHVNEVRLLDVADEAHHEHLFAGLDRLLEIDMRRDIEGRQLARARNAASERQLWENFDMIFGSPERLSEGVRVAASDQLCLAIGRGETRSPFGFWYRLDPANAGHVSLVVGYRGSGDDSDMVALLLQASGSAAALSIYRQDGTTWELAGREIACDLPLAGHLVATVSPVDLVIEINGGEVLHITAEGLGIARCDEGLGIRWMGSEVKPLSVVR